jgi:hypothetical protein
MSNNQASIVDIYTEYVQLRQNGWSNVDSVRQLQPLANELTKDERRQLSQLVQEWEARGGDPTELKPPSAPPQSKKQARSKEEIPSIRRIESPINQATVRKIEPVSISADSSKRRECPNCGKLNHKGDVYCYACGHVLETNKIGTRTFEDEQDSEAQMRWGTAHFGQFSTMMLQVRGAPRPIEVATDKEVIVGRSDQESSVHPDIDLGPYRAEELGVSRLHIILRRQENTITVSDLNSKNHTYINGQRLHPNEVRALRDGDELRLGRLTLRITFKHNIRRIVDR